MNRMREARNGELPHPSLWGGGGLGSRMHKIRFSAKFDFGWYRMPFHHYCIWRDEFFRKCAEKANWRRWEIFFAMSVISLLEDSGVPMYKFL